MGKTHLVALLAHRLEASAAPIRVAWLDEDPWRIRDFPTLTSAIARKLGAEPGASVDETIASAAGDGFVVVLIENLDMVFDALGTDGERQLRALLERTPRIVLVATTTARFPAIRDADRSFYGMFDIDDLEGLDLGEAHELLLRIATRAGDDELHAFLQTNPALARLKVVAHLAGGHPRVWLLLAGCLNVPALDELIPLFIRSLDDLTPYYQSRIADLSRFQRAIVMALVDAEGALQVSTITEAVDGDQRAVSVALRDLVGRGYVREATTRVAARGDKRARWYELAEPLMRMTLKVKESRGEPLEVVVAFLRAWYGTSLREEVARTPQLGAVARAYIEAALDARENDRVDSTDLVARARAAFSDERFEPALELLLRHEQMQGDNPSTNTLLGVVLQSLNRHEEALERLKRGPRDISTLYLRAVSLHELARSEEALGVLEPLLRDNPTHSEGWRLRVAVLSALKRHQDAVLVSAAGVSACPDDLHLLRDHGIALLGVRLPREAIAVFTRLVNDTPDDGWLHCLLGRALLLDERYEEALESLDTALSLDQSTLTAVAQLRSMALVALGVYSAAEQAALERLAADSGGPSAGFAAVLASLTDQREAATKVDAETLGAVVGVGARSALLKPP